MTTVADFLDRIVRELQSHGILHFSVNRGGKHPYLQVPGVGGKFVFAGSSGDRLSVHNMLSDLRRWLGVKRKVHKNPRNRRRKLTVKRDHLINRIHEIHHDSRKSLAEQLGGII